MTEHIPQVEPPKSKRTVTLVAIAAIIVVVAGVIIYAVSGGSDSAEGRTKITLGTVGASDPYWKTFQDEAAKQGIDLEVKDFADYPQPNPALAEGEIDINQFQHNAYLAEYNAANDKQIVPIGATAIYPLGLYSKKLDSVDQIKKGDTVVVPDDDSNQARGLVVLQKAGLVELKDGGTIYSTLSDVDQAKSKVKVKAIKADLTPTSLEDVSAAIVNNDFVEKAGLKFEDALAKDDPADPKAKPYINFFAVRAEDKDNPTYRKLVKIYQDSKPVLDGVQKVAGGTAVFTKESAEELQKTQAETLKIAKAKK